MVWRGSRSLSAVTVDNRSVCAVRRLTSRRTNTRATLANTKTGSGPLLAASGCRQTWFPVPSRSRYKIRRDRSQCRSQTSPSIDPASHRVVIHRAEIDRHDFSAKIAAYHHMRCRGRSRSTPVVRARITDTRQQTVHKRKEQFTRG